MENKKKIKQKLGHEAGERLIAQLDEDDILNVDEALRRHKYGIDLDFLVGHVGGDFMGTQET